MAVHTADRAAVEVRDIKKRFGDTEALAGVSLDFPAGSFISILGPSGCGKTTLLRIIAGLEYQDSGTVGIDGADVSKTPPHKRPVNLVFQRYALFPHKTVFENIAFSLRLGRVPAPRSRAGSRTSSTSCSYPVTASAPSSSFRAARLSELRWPGRW